MVRSLIRSAVVASSLALALATGTSSAQAACAFENGVPVSMLAPGFPAWKAIADAAGECGNFSAELDQEFRSKQVPAMQADPSLYTVAGLNAATFASLTESRLLRPLDDLLAEHAPDMPDRRKVRIDGQTYAIAVMVNAQHLLYRSDVFEELGLEPPSTYAEMLEVAAAIQDAGTVRYPIGGTFKSGFDIGEEFINMYLGHGGALLGPDNELTLDREAGRATLETLRAMTEFMDPEFTVSDSTYVQQQFQQGDIAITNLWASRAGAMDDEGESSVAGLVASAPAPAAIEGGAPASTIWWGGWGIAQNVTDEEAEAAFRVMLEGSDREMVEANNDLNIWLIEGYEPPALAQGALATMEGGAPNYPASAAMAMLHAELGQVVNDYVTGQADADAVLDDIERRYETAARREGLIQ